MPIKSLKIALVSPYDAAFAGGVNEHVRQLSHYFRLWGHDVKIIAPSSRPSDDPHLIPIGRVTPVAVNGSVARVSLSITLAPAIRRVLKHEQFDLAHVHEPLSPTLPTTFLSCSNIPNIGTFHAASKRSIGYTFVQTWLKRVEPKLNGRIAVSEAAREFANRYFPADYTIIPNGVDVATYSRPTAPMDLPDNDDSPTVLFVGRYNEERKGFRFLLEAMGLVQRHHPNVRLIVAGGGDPEPFKALFRQYNVRNVHFLGFVSKQELAALYQQTTVFCAPSTGGESFGIVLLEAMAAGAAIVAADNPGYRDVLEHRKQGLLVPAKNAESLAVAILHLLDNESTRHAMADMGYSKAQDYAWDRIAQRIMQYYVNVVNGKQ